MTNSWTKWLLFGLFEHVRSGNSADPSLNATVAAIADIEAALEATADAGPVGHGTIRLSGRAPLSNGGPAGVASATQLPRQLAVAAAPPKWAGHGAIRLLAHSPRSSAQHAEISAEPDPAGVTETAGHEVFAAVA